MTKYHNISDSVPKMVLRNGTVQTFLRIVSAGYNFKNHLWYRMGYIVIFNRLAGIPYVALLVRPMVHIYIYNYIYIYIYNHDCNTLWGNTFKCGRHIVLTPLFLPSSSVSLSFFNLAVPMRMCWENTRA